MLLPGGIVRDGERRRRFAFRPIDGALEVALAEAVSAPSMPEAVTAALAATLAEVGGEPATAEVVRGLAVGDRQFLVRQLSAHLGRDRVWLTASCGACGESFDFEVAQAALPVKEAGAGYPFAEVETPGSRIRLRVPTGADQEAIAGLPDGEALRVLFARCLVEGEAEDDGELAAAEAAVEAAAPEVALAALAACPACRADNEVAVDPYLPLSARSDDVFLEVHRLASSYHWSEAEILALPRARRQVYLRLIDRSRGMVQ
jgi:hypothetical protein